MTDPTEQREPATPRTEARDRFLRSRPDTATGSHISGTVGDLLDVEREAVERYIAAQPAPQSREALRELATDVLHSWDAGDIDNDYDRIASAFDALRDVLSGRVYAPPVEPVAAREPQG